VGGLILAALESTLARPGWWAVAAAGFLARGGILLFLLVLVDPPTPVTVTFIFGIDSITAGGSLSERFITTVAILTVAAFAASAAASLVAAWADTTLFGGPGRAPGRLVLSVSWLQAVGLLPALAAIGLALGPLRDAVIGELLLPSATDTPYLARVVVAAQGPLLRVLLVFALVDLLATVATRFQLAARGARSTLGSYGAASAWLVRRAPRALGVWLVGWAVLGATVLAGLGATAVAWIPVRAAFLDPALPLPWSGDAVLEGAIGLALAAALSALFVLVWIATVAVVGLASAFRGRLWTLAVGASQEAGTAYDGAPWPR
jgi:hypothetical protein